MKIDFAADVSWHGEDSLVRPLKRPVRIVGCIVTSRTTAGLIALRASPIKRARNIDDANPGFRSLRSLHPGLHSFACCAGSLSCTCEIENRQTVNQNTHL